MAVCSIAKCNYSERIILMRERNKVSKTLRQVVLQIITIIMQLLFHGLTEDVVEW